MGTVHARSNTQLVLWTLKLAGNVINDENGKAFNALYERVVAFSKASKIKPMTRANCQTATSNLVYRGDIARDSDGGHRTYGYSLQIEPTGVNPFAGTAVATVASAPSTVSDAQVADVIANVSQWSLTKRIELVHELTNTLRRDMGAFRDVVIEGI